MQECDVVELKVEQYLHAYMQPSMTDTSQRKSWLLSYRHVALFLNWKITEFLFEVANSENILLYPCMHAQGKDS